MKEGQPKSSNKLDKLKKVGRALAPAILAGSSLGLFFDTVLEIQNGIITNQAQKIQELEEQINPSLAAPSPTEIPVDLDEQKIAALRKIQQEAVKRDNFI